MTAPGVFGSAGRRTPSATLIMRVWWETNSAYPFRVRFAAIEDDGGTTEMGAATDLETALAAVRWWLDEFITASREGFLDST